MLHLHKKFARDEKIAPEYVCVRAYVCRGCCNINANFRDTVKVFMLLLFKVIGAWQPRETGMAAKDMHLLGPNIQYALLGPRHLLG